MDGGAFFRFLFCWATLAEGNVCAQTLFTFSLRKGNDVELAVNELTYISP